ncbi:hypothetical protein T11_12155 [Trichinella zimbabwensis]|uniref:Uncharacterized protein n=1 Tax=Trichinella zimbabwensis TaxID=268475 RepID=A0A0V1GZB8_9BILA|nr:hypothetical protein T11_12155 [Trichinella zimbabwensis]
MREQRDGSSKLVGILDRESLSYSFTCLDNSDFNRASLSVSLFSVSVSDDAIHVPENGWARHLTIVCHPSSFKDTFVQLQQQVLMCVSSGRHISQWVVGSR